MTSATCIWKNGESEVTDDIARKRRLAKSAYAKLAAAYLASRNEGETAKKTNGETAKKKNCQRRRSNTVCGLGENRKRRKRGGAEKPAKLRLHGIAGAENGATGEDCVARSRRERKSGGCGGSVAKMA